MNLFDDFSEEDETQERPPRCRTCGSTDVRWRQQGDKWVLFSPQPGVEHTCDPEDLAKDFD